MSYIGKAMPGLTNRELVTGRGTFVADVDLPDMAHLAVVRSPHAHARIKSVDFSRALALPGVLAVLEGKEIAANTNPIPGSWDPKEMGAKEVRWFALCPDRARYVGEAVAAVVAEDRYTAYEAASLVDVEYEELPAVLDAEQALLPDSPLVEQEWGDNILVSRDFTAGNPSEKFAQAHGVVTGTVQCNRVTGAPLETRGCVADWNAFKRQLTFWDSTQDPHPLRVFLAETLRMHDREIRVIQPRVGGGFGLKQPTFQEEPLVAYASVKLGRPVRWIEERDEHFVTCGHARDTKFYYEAAHDADGRMTALKIRVIADVGAPTALCGYGMSFVTWYCLPTVYKVTDVQMELKSVVTNKTPWNSYRGYGKDAATFLMERIVEHVARSVGRDSAEVRYANLIQPEDFPWPQPSGAVLDSGDYPRTLGRVLDMVGYADFAEIKAQAREEGRLVGIGISMELTPEGASVPGSLIIGGFDGTTVRLSPTGDVLVLTGVTSPGSGNETAMAQIAADALGCDVARVKVIQGDTDSCPWGLGNYSSRSVIIGGSATHQAAMQLRVRLLEVAGRMLEAAPDELDAADGSIFLVDDPRTCVPLQEVVEQFYRHPHGKFMNGMEPALEATSHFKIGNVYHQPETQGRLSTYPIWPYGAAAAIVEVDPDTGVLSILKYCYTHDAGTIINPLLVEANLHGGIAQGIGGALYEEVLYDEDGQPRTTTFVDYLIPTAVEMPYLELDHTETPSPFTPLGTKGVGESGLGACLNALASAAEDALWEYGVRLNALPLSPEHIWNAIQESKANGPGHVTVAGIG